VARSPADVKDRISEEMAVMTPALPI